MGTYSPGCSIFGAGQNMTVEFLSVGILSKESDTGKNVNCFAHLPVPPQAMHDKQS